MAKSKEKVCLNCKAIYEGEKCTLCGETPSIDTIKGRLHVFNAEKSEIANKLGIHKEGEFAIKTK
jgi:RNA polymerase subunit RPABC4/transcription elongation factor Spt4